MLKKNLFTILAMVMAMALMITACGGQEDVDVGGNPTVESSMEVGDVTDTTDTGNTDVVVSTTEPTVDPDTLNREDRKVAESDGYYLYLEPSSTKYNVDISIIDNPFDVEEIIIITEPIEVFGDNGIHYGYTMDNVEMTLVAGNNEWSCIKTKEGFTLFVRTEELNNAILVPTPEPTEIPIIESTPTPEVETTPVPSRI